MTPKLAIHDRRTAGAILSRSDTEAIVACFASHADADVAIQSQASQLLGSLRSRRQWLSCSCATDDKGNRPLIAPRQRDGVLHVVRLTGVSHDPACPFFRDPTELDAAKELSSIPDRAGRVPLRPINGADWLVLQQGPAPGVSSSGPGHHSLAVVLFTALDLAGYTVLDPEDVLTLKGHVPTSPKGAKPYERIQAINDLHVAPGITWKDIGCTFLPGLPGFMASMPGKSDLFGEARPQGFFVGQIHGVERGSLHDELLWQGKLRGSDTEVRVPVEGVIKRRGAIRDCSGPFWCAAIVGRRLGEREFRVLGAYLHPVFSKSLLLPVDNDLERVTAQLLMEQIRFWMRSEKINQRISLSKPLFDEKTPDGLWCRPGFSLLLPTGKRILIDTLKTDAVLASGADAGEHFASVRSLPDVVAHATFMPGRDMPADFQKSLTRLVVFRR